MDKTDSLPKSTNVVDVDTIFRPGVCDVVRTGSALTGKCYWVTIVHCLVPWMSSNHGSSCNTHTQRLAR